MRCEWLERDGEGRPRCAHGWAFKAGTRWRCRQKAAENVRRYRHTEAGRDMQRRQNASPQAKSSKAIYDLTRVRVTY